LHIDLIKNKMFELANQNIVIVANLFNPSVFNSHWFIKNEIVNEEEILPTSIFAQDLAQLSTKDFNLLVLLNQLILTVSESSEISSIKKLTKCISLLKHTPFTAVGINFIYNSNQFDETDENWSRSLFYNTNSKIYQSFNSTDSKFGIYLSKDYHSSRLKLDIKPVNSQEIGSIEVKEVINYNFNFHKDLDKENAFDDLIQYLEKWNDFRVYSLELMNNILPE